jgi:hypothetical protein
MVLMASYHPSFTARTAANVGVLLRGAVCAHGPRTVTGCLLAAWPWVTKDWSAYAHVLSRARVDLHGLSRLLFLMILKLIPRNAVIELIIDETLVRRYGPRVVGVGMHRDAVRSSKARRTATPGHKWVVLSVVVRLPYVHRALALPLASALYTTQKHARRNRAKRPYNRHRTIGELTKLLVRMAVRWAPDRRFRLMGDGAYGTHDLADAMNPDSRSCALRQVTLVSRFRPDAATYGPPPVYAGRGRPAEKGRKLPTPAAIAQSRWANWKPAVVDWYGGTRKTVPLCSRDGLWYKCGHQAKRVRWVLVRDPEGKRRDEIFFTTDMRLSPKQIVEAFVRRWSLETTFEEMREQLGLETLRNRTSLAVRRSVPLLMGVYSLVVVWFARHVRHPKRYKRETPWYTKRSVTFSDMLAAARQDIQREAFSRGSGPKTRGFFLWGLHERPLDTSKQPIRRRA